MAGSPSPIAVGKGTKIPSILQQNAAASGRNRGCTDLKVVADRVGRKFLAQAGKSCAGFRTWKPMA